ncbi:MAG: hypothetical protein GEV05_06025 [Betaproteobacteria bacterium]|nr:hypothetical protein [Betaproteobacteria bacterium]
MKIDFLIDACSQPSAAEARHATLERFIARGDPIPFDAADLEACLQALFDLPRERGLPAAPLSLLGDGIEPGGDEWLRLDPVHLRADRSRLLLVPLPPDDVTPAEAEMLQAALEAHFAQSGFQLVSGAAGRWYVRSPRPLELRTQPPQTCAGALDEQHLPAGADGAEFRRLVTEAQMLLHDLPMNAAREASGKLPITGVWPWGNGRMPAIGRSRYSHAYSDDPVVRGIARASGAEAATLPADATALTHLPPDAALLVVCPAAGTPLADIERNWIGPFAKQIEAGALAELRLLLLGSGRSIGRGITRQCLRRWWRRARPLAHA